MREHENEEAIEERKKKLQKVYFDMSSYIELKEMSALERQWEEQQAKQRYIQTRRI